ncbi:AAEL009477-PB [Aedes aegypti]|uniref:AAEL009477-PB n=1 Tax=Aedes aegypti TaxID=7159 RepID=Q16VN6_AEDAE|nr:AAEL009477-PB [Aedes aegypti]
MGHSTSKERSTPNNPWEAEIARKKRREQNAKERAAERKRLEKQQKRAEKEAKRKSDKKKRKSKLDDLKDTEPPPIVRKSKAQLEESDYDSEAIRRMKEQLAFNSDIFVLNQLLLGVQFYGNYERDMWDAVERNRREENDRNGKISRHCKTVILPDRLQEAVDQRVKFLAKHGPHKNKLQPLHTQTCYVIHENIEISNPGETSVYSILTDAPVYKLELEDGFDEKIGGKRKSSNVHYGYVKLKSVEYIKPNNPSPLDVIDRANAAIYGESSGLNRNTRKQGNAKSSSISDSDTMDEEDDDEDEVNDAPIVNFGKLKFRDSIAIKMPKLTNGGGIYGTNSLLNPSTSTSSTSPPSSEYDYAYITAINTHQPLSVMKSVNDDQPISTTVLPDYCVTTINCSSELNQGYYSDDESDADKLLYLAKNGLPMKSNPTEYVTERKQYLNSKGFLAYFINLFQDTLAYDLRIKKENLDNATWKGAIIYCDQWEIVPAVVCPWPREASEWIQRKREVKVNPLTKQKFQWPTAPMIQKVKSFGCHVIPTGYAPKVGTNRHRQLEWKIVFPEAERYLESCLTNTQVKIYMLTKLLLKTFVDPALVTNMNMFGNEHLRAHLFWQCESNYAAWPEDYIGEALLRFLNGLLDRIKTHKLPDYFLPSRNLFENIPERVLVELHKRIFRITENPVMHLMIALRNMKLPGGQTTFYPKLKIKRIYSVMIIDNPLKIVNPRFRDENENLAAEDSAAEDQEKEVAVGMIAYFNEQEVESRKQRTRIVRFMEAEKKKIEQQEERRVSTDSIDLMFNPLKHMENLRRQLIYNIFVQHFIEMAQVSYVFRSLNQGLIYLKQAERICSLLTDDHGIEESRQFLTKIFSVRNELLKAINNASYRPALPKRASSAVQSPQQRRIRMKSPKQNGRKGRPSYSNVSPDSHSQENTPRQTPERIRKRSARQVATTAQVHSPVRTSPPTSTSDEQEDISRLLGNITIGA